MAVSPPQFDHHFFQPHPDARPVFVVGQGRSGTTMLRLMLQQAPELAMLSETWFGPRVWDRRWSFPIRHGADPFLPRLLDTFIDLLGRHGDFPMDMDAYRRRVLDGPADLARLLDELGRQWAEQEGAPRWGEKTPVHVDYVQPLAAMFPGATFCVLLRDPRDAAASLVDAPFAASTDPVSFGVEWLRTLATVEQWTDGSADADLAAHGLEARVVVVRYEDLVDTPDRELVRVCAAAEVTFVDRMLSFDQSAGRLAPDQPWMAGLHKPLNRGSIGRWQGDLAPEAVRAVEALTGPAMRRWGYEPSGAATTADEELAASLWHGVVQDRAEQDRRTHDHVQLHRGAYRDLVATIAGS